MLPVVSRSYNCCGSSGKNDFKYFFELCKRPIDSMIKNIKEKNIYQELLFASNIETDIKLKNLCVANNKVSNDLVIAIL